MSQFKIDEQTRFDLSLSIKDSENASIFKLYQTVTPGGAQKLAQYFNYPLSDAQLIEGRQQAIACIQQQQLLFNFSKEELGFIEHYLSQVQPRKKASGVLLPHSLYAAWFESKSLVYLRTRGVNLVLSNFSKLHHYLTEPDFSLSAQLQQYRIQLLELMNSTRLEDFLSKAGKETVKQADVVKFDSIIQLELMDTVKWMLTVIYEIDALTAVAATSIKLNFSAPRITTPFTHLVLEDFFHPLISNPVASSIKFTPQLNLCMVTGANMAGKSSLLKAMAICIYMAQCGFPVPARRMEFSIFNGLSTTINIADSITMGHSHFYKEVLRIKEVAIQLAGTGKMFVIFDELFRGTNSADAYEASLAVLKALAEVRTSFFVISTHLTEIAPALANLENISFKCLKTNVENGKINYNYRLQDGVSTERLGMRIVTDEKLVLHIQQASKTSEG